MERTFLAAGTSNVFHLKGPAVLDLVDVVGRNLPFLVQDETNPQLNITVEKGQEWSGRVYNTVSAAAGAPVDGTVRVMPIGVSYQRWEGQVGQEQVLNLTCNAGGTIQFTEADLVVPPDATGIRLSWGATALGNLRFHTLTFTNLRYIEIPPLNSGVFQCPLLSPTFTYQGFTILYDGSDHMAQGSPITVIVSFLKSSPVRTFVNHGYLYFADEDNIAQASTYYFALALENLNRYKRITWDFTYDYEDDANTAGGNVLFYPEDPVTLGAIAYVSWAFPLGTDVGADRRGVQCLNVVDPSYYCIIGIQNSDAAKDIDNWLLVAHGVDEY